MASDVLPSLLAYRAALLGAAPFLTHLDHRTATRTMSWAQVDAAVDAVAAWTRARTAPGDRVAVCAAHGPDWVVAFLGVLRAGRIAVPLHSPRLPVPTGRLTAALADSAPSLCLTSGAELPAVREFLAGTGIPVAAVDELPPARALPSVVAPHDVAYLQYTSGRAGGVVLTHGNVVANARQAVTGCDAGAVVVSWLPLFHAAGLALAVAGPVVHGTRVVLLDPVAFLERPVRWLRALADQPGAVTAAPDFAYRMTAARVTAAERAELDLSRVRAVVHGPGPVAPGTVDRFHRAFAPCGLAPSAHRVSYGLAEATALVSATPPGEPRRRTADRAATAGATLVSAGRPAGQEVRIVEDGRELPDGHVGEIWVGGPNVATGYWRDPVRTAAVFGAVLADGSGPWLRTGDLGVRHDGELYVTSRTSEVIVLDGFGHHPQDIEAAVRSAHPAIRSGHVVAVAVPGPGGDRVVVLAERSRWTVCVDPAEVAAAVREATTGLPPVELVLLEPGALPTTAAGEVSRPAARLAYLDGAFAAAAHA
jgi:acyl-CoA synthetase (AMP-forming)/AMP-acid ligase II